MQADQRALFEEKLNSDAGLREDVELQRELMKGIGRLALQGKIRAARRHYLRTRYLKWGGLGSGFVVVVVAAVLLLGKSGGVRSIQPGIASPERHIPAQGFVLDGSRDTVVVTKGGIVLVIPAGGFLDENGQPVKGSIDIQLREALDPATILRSGLSTRSGNRLLETAGMFDLEVSRNGKALRVNPAAKLYARIPTDSVRKDMLLFTGKRLADGSIDWVNPREPEHFLIPVDIHALDFYPPHYLDSLRRWGYPAGNKVFTDSLYYSLARYFYPNDSTGWRGAIELDYDDHTPRPFWYAGTEASRDSLPRGYDGTTGIPEEILFWMPCGINPAGIKTIWADRFQNTLIATREFEERMRLIHESADPKLLHLYVNHLDLPLSTIDSMAAGKSSGDVRQRFLAFAARHEGGIAIGIKQVELLKNYYVKKTQEYTIAITRVQRAYWSGQAKLDSVAQEREREYEEKESARMLRISRDYSMTSRAGYTVEIVQTGWHNMDRYVVEASSTVVTPEPAVVRVEPGPGYDAVFIYLLPDQLSSFIRMSQVGDRFSEPLLPRLKFSLIAIAYKDEQAFFYSRNEIHSGENPAIALSPVDRTTLDRELSRLASVSQAADLRKEQEYRRFEVQDNKRIQQNNERLILTRKVVVALYPCYPAGEAGK